MSSRLDFIRPVFHALRRAGIDLQSPHRRAALNPMTVQKRILAGTDVRVILDCGAHHGRVAREYAAAFPGATVHSFEPTPATFSVLRSRVASHARIRPINAAVGEAEGEVDFFIAPFEQANSLLPRHPGRPELEQRVRVRVRRIDEYCREQSIEQVEILKLDVEGYEGPALRGCGRLLEERRIRVIVAETRFDSGREAGGSNTTFPDLCALLLPLGYRFYGLYDPRYDEDLKFDWGDVIFAAPR